MTQHSFDIDIAKEYGILEAVLLTHLQFWIEKNRANETNFFDGEYWTYNSTRAFNELFPYVSERQIKTALKHLRDEGIIKVGNYNTVAYDRTLWYAFTKKGQSIVQKCPMDSTKMSNGKAENVRPIPNINTDINTDNKPNKKRKKESSYDEILSSIADDDLRELYLEYIKMRKMIKAPMTDRALTMLIKKVNELEPNSLENQKKLLETASMNNWKSVYPLKNAGQADKVQGKQPSEQEKELLKMFGG